MGGFRHNNTGDAHYYSIEDFDTNYKVRTCFSTRIGGVSEGGYSSLNLGYKTDDDKSNIDKNIDILCRSAGFIKEDLVFSDQNHGDRCRMVDYGDRGKGTVIPSDIVGVDALITNVKDAALCIFTADCVPVFLMDTVNDVIALCHAGWRGVINKIVPKTISKMCSNYGTMPENIISAIAPSIGPCCFNVGTDVAEQFINAFGHKESIVIEENGKYRINLWNALICQLEMEGIDIPVINSGLCTCCHRDRFYSYRRDGSAAGRMISIMQLI